MRDTRSRHEILREGFTRQGKYVEVGPSFGPILAKRDGWTVEVVDWADRAGLIEHYATDRTVDPDAIEAVDHVWTGGPIHAVLPPEALGTFDGFVASHVIEHTTDVVAFLQSASKLIKPDGIVSLAVPDKRLMFDFFRPSATTADAILAFKEGRSRHDGRTHFMNAAYCVSRDGSPAWPRLDTRPFRLNGDLRAAFEE